MTGISVGRTPRQKRETRVAWLFLAPCFLGFLVVRLLPTLFTFVLSLFNWDLIGTPTFAGLDLLGDMLEDATFYRVLSQTFYYVVGCLVCRLVLGLVLSSIFQRDCTSPSTSSRSSFPGRQRLWFGASCFRRTWGRSTTCSTLWGCRPCPG